MSDTTQLSPATSLPSATQHQVEHLFDSPLTFQEYSEHLEVSYKQISWLRSILSSIRADGDVERGFIVANRAEIGEHIADGWISELDQRQKEFGAALARSMS